MIKINLLAERKAAKAKAPSTFKLDMGGSQNFLLVGILLLGLVSASVWSLMRSNELKHVQAEKVEAEAELKRLEDVRKKAEAFKKQKEILERKINLITELKKKQAVPVHILDQVSRNLPDFMWLDSMTASSNAISIIGKATTYNAVSNLYDNLRASGQFSDVVMGKTNENGDHVAFSLTCKYAPPGAAAAAASDASPATPAVPKPPQS
ncbi:MAG TPA: PilN domain-containing protein [Candidatus Polarisedimenticolaceae bacterium]|nr:PilN domain-containing protein [Candidatus Polarisedimenticolaceae bacterium]